MQKFIKGQKKQWASDKKFADKKPKPKPKSVKDLDKMEEKPKFKIDLIT